MDRYDEHGFFTRFGADQVAAEFRNLQPKLAESTVVQKLSGGWAVIVQPGYRICDKCHGTGRVGDDQEYHCVESLIGSPSLPKWLDKNLQPLVIRPNAENGQITTKLQVSVNWIFPSNLLALICSKVTASC